MPFNNNSKLHGYKIYKLHSIFSLPANTSIGGYMVKLQFNNMAKGKYSIQLLQADGKFLQEEIYDHTEQYQYYIMSLNHSIPAGFYLLRINTGNTVLQKIPITIQ